MPDVTALVTPSVLKWARRRAGHSVNEVAEELHVAAAQVRAWETSNAVQPTVSQAEQLADLYDLPLAFFYLSCPPRGALLPSGQHVLINLIIAGAIALAGAMLGTYAARAMRQSGPWREITSTSRGC